MLTLFQFFTRKTDDDEVEENTGKTTSLSWAGLYKRHAIENVQTPKKKPEKNKRHKTRQTHCSLIIILF